LKIKTSKQNKLEMKRTNLKNSILPYFFSFSFGWDVGESMKKEVMFLFSTQKEIKEKKRHKKWFSFNIYVVIFLLLIFFLNIYNLHNISLLSLRTPFVLKKNNLKTLNKVSN